MVLVYSPGPVVVPFIWGERQEEEWLGWKDGGGSEWRRTFRLGSQAVGVCIQLSHFLSVKSVS